jgi:hypothetical protein
MHTDALNRKFEDELTRFLLWFMEKPKPLLVPMALPMTFLEGIHGVTVYRQPPFQVQLFLAAPNTVIPTHTHPNIDSYEVFLYGMEFTHSDNVIISMEQAMLAGASQNGGQMPNRPLAQFQTIRVLPDDRHGGRSSLQGGAFLSVQHWRNDVAISSVERDWDGNTMGRMHEANILQNSGPETPAWK